MKVPVYGLKGEARGSVVLGPAFNRPVRHDMIKKAVMVERSGLRQGVDVRGRNRSVGRGGASSGDDDVAGDISTDNNFTAGRLGSACEPYRWIPARDIEDQFA